MTTTGSYKIASDSKFVFDSCCCCVPLRTGSLILGYLQLVVLILSGLFAILGIGAGIALFHAHSGSEAKEEEYQTVGTVFIALSVVMLVLMIISLPFTILLLVGLHKEIRRYVKYYLIFVVVSLVLHVILTIGKFAGGYAPGKEAPSAVISIILSIYFFLVLRSQYIKMGFTNNVPTQHYRDGQLMNIQKV